MKAILASFLEIMMQFYFGGGGSQCSAVNDSNAVKSLPSLFRQMIKRREVGRGSLLDSGSAELAPPNL